MSNAVNTPLGTMGGAKGRAEGPLLPRVLFPPSALLCCRPGPFLWKQCVPFAPGAVQKEKRVYSKNVFQFCALLSPQNI